MGWSTHASGTLDPPEVRNWRIHLVALVASCSALAMGYDTAVIGGTMALDSFRRDFDLAGKSQSHRDTVQGNIVSTFQAGCFFGALLTFPLAEKWGRRKTVMLAALVFLIGGTLMTAAHGKLEMIIAGRAVAGLGIGASSLVVPVYIAETAPPSIRAERILCRLRGLDRDHEYVRREMGEIRQQVEERSTMRMSKKQQFKKLFQKGTRNRMGIGMALMFLQSFTGVNIITYYAPRIFETLGVSGTSLRLFSTGFYGIAKTLGMICFTFYVVEKVGRRKGLIWGAALGCIPMWYIGGYVMRADPAGAAAAGVVNRDAWGYLAMVCVYVNGFIICATWQGITWTYCSEIFPLDIRMLCVAITTADTWLGSFIIARSTPYMISDLGYGAYFFFSAILVCMGIWAFIFVPETKGITLEEMDALFMKPMHKAVWAQLRGKELVPERTDSVSDEKKYIESEQFERKE
ncbi:quinate permease [Verticillium alfalfae VaMs.102]|uniref:Quinate permease n=1 Tax=Verticillium alfalfae (strain VaMs.102 / ATCC MYA-4576 / FGSC 10136) TaxID=526221 RepID=C9SDB9_VERA1|nr:quinate permease [Verticillium alfalfae VaMs.102]EEY17071.1 quinate permease [Verticillium alfalfae VaMs.102]